MTLQDYIVLAVMTRHDYIVLGMAGMFLVTNFLGLAFTIARLYSQAHRSKEQHRDRSPAAA
jgi:hypothetical protein